jgi:DNA-binding transcriptional MerR regulator
LDKAPDAFRTISEVADELDVPQHVLRFWESRFPQIRPMKRAGGRRYYRPDDVDLLRGIRHLLYGEGYTIRGVQRILREQGPRFVQAVWQPGAAQPAPDEDAADTEQLAPDEAARTLFGLLKSPEPGEPDAPAEPGLSHDDERRLKAALQDLDECRKLIDEALKVEAA